MIFVFAIEVNLWTMGMLVRCLRITNKNKLMSIRQIQMMNQIIKNTLSLSTERVLHDPVGLFVQLAISEFMSAFSDFKASLSAKFLS